jgi:hypothetical protein
VLIAMKDSLGDIPIEAGRIAITHNRLISQENRRSKRAYNFSESLRAVARALRGLASVTGGS